MRVGQRVNRDHGALKLQGVILQGERRPYASVTATFNGQRILIANRDSYGSSGDMTTIAPEMFRIAGRVAMNLARQMER